MVGREEGELCGVNRVEEKKGRGGWGRNGKKRKEMCCAGDERVLVCCVEGKK